MAAGETSKRGIRCAVYRRLVMRIFNESIIEDTALRWFGDLGKAISHEPYPWWCDFPNAGISNNLVQSAT